MLGKIFNLLMIIFSMVIFFVAGILSFDGCSTANQQHRNARNRIKIIAEVEIPSDSEIVFHYRADNDFANGRAEQFTVFQFDNEPTDWLQENNFLRSDDETKTDDGQTTLVRENEKGFWNFFKNETENGQKVPKEYVPNCEIFYQWIRTNGVHFFYYPDSLRLIVYVTWS